MHSSRVHLDSRNKRPNVEVCAGIPEIVKRIEASIVGLFRGASASQPVRVILAGGTSPKVVYSSWAKMTEVDWSHVRFYFGDERVVGPTHPSSNYRMVRKAFFDTCSIPSSSVFRVHGELPVEDARAAYEQEIRKVAEFDYALLGMGGDGHTASLFPEESEKNLQNTSEVISVERPDFLRVSLNYSVFARTKKIDFFVPGKEKADALSAVLGAETGPNLLPAARVARSTLSTFFVEK